MQTRYYITLNIDPLGIISGLGVFGFVLVREVCEAIVDILLPRYIKVPSCDHLCDVVDGFDCKWGFPQCAGAIDGTHIPFMSPTE